MTTSTEPAILQPPDAPFRGAVGVPGDKSLSHRALIFGALASGSSWVHNLGPGADIESTRNVLTMLGVDFDGAQMTSPGRDVWSVPTGPLDCGNSGTTMRLLAGALAAAPFTSTLTGDQSLRSRPMGRLVAPLQALGAEIDLNQGATAPVVIDGSRPLTGADVEIPIASAQVRTAFALGALAAEGASTIASPPGYRDHTERWLESLGRGRWLSPNQFQIIPGSIEPFVYSVPGDPSSAAFLWAAAALKPGARVTTPNISLNPGRIGFLQILEMMGAGIEAAVTGTNLGDPVGTVAVTGRGLRAADIEGELAVAALDELPLVAVLGAYAEGITTVRDAAELRVKESDRIATSVAMIRALGGGAEPAEDGFAIVGTGWLEPGTVEAHHDHRIAMAAGVAATGALGPVTVAGADAASVSWPDFFRTLEALWSSQ